MGEFSLSHLLVLGIILLIFFRKDQLPSLGKSIGKAIRGFKEGLSEIDVNAKDIHDDVKKQIPENHGQMSQADTSQKAANVDVTSDSNKGSSGKG